MNKEDMAVEIFQNNFNCAQAVLGAFCNDLGFDRDTAMKIATGLGSGMKAGEVCGSVSGAVLVLGLKFGHGINADTRAKEETSRLTQEFHKRFKKEQSSMICRDILGLDPADPVQYSEITKKDLFNRICPSAIKTSVRILSELI